MFINYIFGTLCKPFQHNLFEILLVLSLLAIVGIFLYNTFFKKGETGTWSDEKYYNLLQPKTPVKNSKYSSHNTSGVKGKQGGESKGEIESRRVLEKIFKTQFPKARPDFLKNPVTGGVSNLELDCYNDEMKLGLEYNGVQHYKFKTFFHKNKDQFTMQKYRDDMKTRMCKEKGITLIEVPYTVKLNDIENFIKDELTKLGII